MAAAAAYRVEEAHLWKCPNHPSKRHRHGVCPNCLRDRLISLCPNCGNVAPCLCNAVLSNSSSSSSTSSSSVDGDPSLGRSRSLAVPFFLRSNHNRAQTASITSIFRRRKSEKKDGGEGEENHERNVRIEEFVEMISRSRSVGVGKMTSGTRRDDVMVAGKGKFWNLKAFRSSKNSRGR